MRQQDYLQQLSLLTLPIFLQEGQEYCFVVLSNSLEYKVWISQMGERDVGGSNRVISSQPHLGLCLNHKIIEHGMQCNHKI